MTRTAYAALGVKPTASQAEIKSAYYRLARETHPDVAGGPSRESTVEFGELSAAYEILSCQNRREAYDLQLSASATASLLDHSELNERMAEALLSGRLADGLALFLQVHAIQPLPLWPENGARLLTLCAKRAHVKQAGFVFGRLRDADLLTADGCNTWFTMCIAHNRAAEAMEVHRLMEARGLQPSASVRACLRQIRAYGAVLAQQSDDPATAPAAALDDPAPILGSNLAAGDRPG